MTASRAPRFQLLALLGLTLAGFALRLHYLTTSHPFFDEYTTVLAARQILRHGWPLLPSGLFYEHGLLATYLIAPFAALFIDTPLESWQPAQWGLMLARWPSLLLSTATIPLIYRIGTRSFEIENPKSRHRHASGIQNPTWLLAAGLFALSPEGMVWGGRARMYALATFLMLLTVYWAYRGALYPAPAKYRWLALLALLAALLTQLGALMLVPPLLVAMLAVAWLSWPRWPRVRAGEQGSRGAGGQGQHLSSMPSPTGVWFLRPAIWLEGAALAGVIGLAVLVKRLGRPVGMASLAESESGPATALLNTITYQTAIHFTWPDTLDFLARQFGVPHHFWLASVTLIGLTLGLVLWLIKYQLTISNDQLPITKTNISLSPNLPCSPAPPLLRSPALFLLFLCLIFGLIILEMVSLLDPFRRNPRYLVMYLPLFYLIAAGAILYVLRFTFYVLRLQLFSRPNAPVWAPVSSLALLALFTALGYNDLRIALVTPEPAYERAFAYVREKWQPGDALLTMNTPAAGLYLGQVDGFTVQEDADQFLLNRETAPVDRWLGAPWVGEAAAFNAALNDNPRVWFVTDTIRQPVYFRGDWLALVNHQMEPVWAEDNALVYLTRSDRQPLPTQPDTLVKAILGETIELLGYTLQDSAGQPAPHSHLEQASNYQSPLTTYHLTLFWQALAPLPTDYTVFLHLRNADGATVAQRDGLPVDGAYQTSRWQPGETVIDPISLPLPEDLPPGDYTLYTGLYRLDTLERLPVANDTSGENAIKLGEISLP